MTNFALHVKLHFYDNYDPLRHFRTYFPGGALSSELNMATKGQEKYEMLANDLLRNYRDQAIVQY